MKIVLQVSEELVEEVEVWRFVGCLAVHESIKGRSKGLTITHVRSGVALANISPFTPYREVKHQIKKLATLFKYELDPRRVFPKLRGDHDKSNT